MLGVEGRNEEMFHKSGEERSFKVIKKRSQLILHALVKNIHDMTKSHRIKDRGGKL